MKKLLIIAAFVLFAFSSCNSDSLDISEQIAIKNLNPELLNVQANDRAARDGRNPQTGETIRVPAKKSCGCYVGESCSH